MNNMKQQSGFKPDFNAALPLSFYQRDTALLARELPGKVIVRKIGKRYLAGMIVETEAYLHENDLSAHSAVGKTERNAPMFEAGGILYVYQIYGIHHCINIVSGKAGKGCAVLIRALQPLAGIDIMAKNRNTDNEEILCKGPGNLAKAFAFTKNENYAGLNTAELFLQEFIPPNKITIKTTKRIGIKKSAELPLRFFIEGSRYVSGKKS